MKSKKGQLSNLFQATVMLIMITIVVGLGVVILEEMADPYQATGTNASNRIASVLTNGSSALGTISTTWTSIIVIILVVGLILGILLGSFAMRRQK